MLDNNAKRPLAAGCSAILLNQDCTLIVLLYDQFLYTVSYRVNNTCGIASLSGLVGSSSWCSTFETSTSRWRHIWTNSRIPSMSRNMLRSKPGIVGEVAQQTFDRRLVICPRRRKPYRREHTSHLSAILSGLVSFLWWITTTSMWIHLGSNQRNTPRQEVLQAWFQVKSELNQMWPWVTLSTEGSGFFTLMHLSPHTCYCPGWSINCRFIFNIFVFTGTGRQRMCMCVRHSMISFPSRGCVEVRKRNMWLCPRWQRAENAGKRRRWFL
jgi:hypothetical protein